MGPLGPLNQEGRYRTRWKGDGFNTTMDPPNCRYQFTSCDLKGQAELGTFKADHGGGVQGLSHRGLKVRILA